MHVSSQGIIYIQRSRYAGVISLGSPNLNLSHMMHLAWQILSINILRPFLANSSTEHVLRVFFYGFHLRVAEDHNGSNFLKVQQRRFALLWQRVTPPVEKPEVK